MSEPVAWITTWRNDEENNHGVILDWDRQIKKGKVTHTPLYTQRNLTDKEVKECFMKAGFEFNAEYLPFWARDVAVEILKKAIEK